nr:glycoside-pentoside-hexuronide (GPH):cation symporter [Enterococcus sp. 665A]
MIGENLDFKEKVAYGFGDAASNVVWASMGAFIMYYYTDIVQVNAAVIGTIFLISRVINAIVYLIVGGLVDKTKSKYGKARPWMLNLAIPFAIAIFALFAVPDFSEKARIVYIFVSYNILMTVYAFINLPYGALSTLMTQDQYQRTLLNIFRQLFAQIASLIITACTLPLVGFFGNRFGERAAWGIVYAIFGAIAGLLFFLCFLGTKERVVQTEEEKQEKVNLMDGIKSILKNKYWYFVVVLGITTNVFFQAISTVNTYYCKAVLHRSDMIGIMNSAYIIPCIASFFIMPFIVKRLGKRYTTLLGWVIILASYAILLPFTENTTMLILTSILRGIGYGCQIAVYYAMLGDTVEYGEWTSHTRFEGLTFSMQGFTGTVGAGVVTAIIGGVLSASKYNGALGFSDIQPDSAVSAIKFLFIGMPAIAGVVSLLVLGIYKLDKLYPSIIADLQSRKSNSKEA